MPEFLKGFYLEELNYGQSLELMWVVVMGVANSPNNSTYPVGKAVSDSDETLPFMDNEIKSSFCNLDLSEPQWLEFFVWVSHHLRLKYFLEALSVELSNLKAN
jgi:hypothetical protein